MFECSGLTIKQLLRFKETSQLDRSVFIKDDIINVSKYFITWVHDFYIHFNEPLTKHIFCTKAMIILLLVSTGNKQELFDLENAIDE